MSFKLDNRRASLKPDNNDESTDDIEENKVKQEEQEKYKLNVEELEHLLQRRQQASKILVSGVNNESFDLNLFVGLEREMSRSSELNTFVQRVDKLIQSHLNKMQNASIDEREQLPTFTRGNSKKLYVSTKFLAKIHYDNNGKKTTKTLPASGDMTADGLITSFFQKQMTNKALDDFGDTNATNWTFKVIGSAQYMYGDTYQLADYEYIQDALSKATRALEIVDMVLTKSEEALSKSSVKRDVKLKDINMDTSYEVEKISEYNYDDIKKNTNVTPLWDVVEPVKCTIVSINDVVNANLRHVPLIAKTLEDSVRTENVLVEAAIQYADANLVAPKYTHPVSLVDNASWDKQLTFDINLCDIPRESILQLTVYHRKGASTDASVLDSDTPIFIIRVPLIDDNSQLVTGKKKLRMWPIPLGTAPTRVTCVNQFDPACSIMVDLGTHEKPVLFTSTGELPTHLKQAYADFKVDMVRRYPNKMNELVSELEAICNSDTLAELNEKDKVKLLFHGKTKVRDHPRLLQKYLLSVPWRYPAAVQEAYKFLKEWKITEVINALQLLDVRYPDRTVRLYAVDALSKLPDDELNLFLLQLVQCVKNEIYHDSPLCRFLLERAIRSSHLIGHSLFWSLKAELHNSFCRERFVLILEQYLKACTNHRAQLQDQITLVNNLLEMALKVKRFSTKSNEERKVYFQSLLQEYKFNKCVLPLNPRMEVTNVIVEKCKVMGSKKLPLWLVFENSEEPEANRLPVIFKAGDDIRQDALTLQLLSMMYNLWRQSGLNVHMKIYGCVSCGDMNGFIEVVQNSDTIANITNDYGGSTAVFSKEPLSAWLKEKNKDTTTDWKVIVDNFARSTSAYCVATYILGIGDRHNDNIMLQSCGDLFHIDFGHFLGNYKKKLNIKRENAPFVFTKMYHYVLVGDTKNDKESEAYTLFKKLCVDAFNIIRKNGDLIMNLLRLMLGTGIPELQTTNDIAWVQKVIVADKDDKQAGDYFVELIGVSLGNYRTKIMEWTHIVSQNIKK